MPAILSQDIVTAAHNCSKKKMSRLSFRSSLIALGVLKPGKTEGGEIPCKKDKKNKQTKGDLQPSDNLL